MFSPRANPPSGGKFDIKGNHQKGIIYPKNKEVVALWNTLLV